MRPKQRTVKRLQAKSDYHTYGITMAGTLNTIRYSRYRVIVGFCFAKDCVAVCASYPRQTRFPRSGFCNAYETCRRHDCRVCDFERDR